ncbi:MAG: DinB family protein, partial [Candidatus Acidiferrales bacterium]
DDWASAMNYGKRDARRALEEFRAMRETNLALLKSLRPEQWKHHGLHAERGEESVERIVRMFAGHDLNHLQQIERIVKSGKS